LGEGGYQCTLIGCWVPILVKFIVPGMCCIVRWGLSQVLSLLSSPIHLLKILFVYTWLKKTNPLIYSNLHLFCL
jgi:hypothetical protein